MLDHFGNAPETKLNVSKTRCIISGRRKKISCLRKKISYKYQYFNKNTAKSYIGHNNKECNNKNLLCKLKEFERKSKMHYEYEN